MERGSTASLQARREAVERGARAESWAAAELHSRGWTLLARNWRGGGGELDLVVVRDRRLRFVEVKARAPEDVTGADAVDGVKQGHLVRAAAAWMEQNPQGWDEAAFLVVVVTLPAQAHRLDAGAEPIAAEWFDDAFDGE